jgi:insertion element IS1 protein InsB
MSWSSALSADGATSICGWLSHAKQSKWWASGSVIVASRVYGTSGSLWDFWFSLPSDYRKKLVYTDFYEAYAKLFRPWQHRPGGKGSGQTSLVEGLNNKWRNRVSGLVRKTVCVRYLADLERRLWLVIEKHNQMSTTL